MTLSDAVTEYLAVLDSGSYSTKRLANALDAVREALAEPSEPSESPVEKPKAKPKAKPKEATK